MWKPDTSQFTTPIRVWERKETTVNGSPKISYAVADPEYTFCNWKSRGGTEGLESGTRIVEDTAEIIAWFRPDITEKWRVELAEEPGKLFDVQNVEDVQKRHMYLILKVKRAVNA